MSLLPTPRHRDYKNGLGYEKPAPHGNDSDTVPRAVRTSLLGIGWGPYTQAVQRWEQVLGRPAPAPTIDVNGKPRLNPGFVEFLMGLPSGHVTHVPDVSRSAALKMLGNGCVPQQVLIALNHLDPR